MFFRKNCHYCKFCYKDRKELCKSEKNELCVLAENVSEDEPKISDLNEQDFEDLYGLRQEYNVKCFKDQWDEETNPELKVQDLKDRTCKYFESRKKNINKTYEQVEKEQNERMGVQMHKETLQWMQISFLVGITSIVIGLISRIPDIENKLSTLLIKLKGLI